MVCLEIPYIQCLNTDAHDIALGHCFVSDIFAVERSRRYVPHSLPATLSKNPSHFAQIEYLQSHVIDLAQVQFGTLVVDAQAFSDPDHPPQNLIRANKSLVWRSIATPEYPIDITLLLPLQSDVRRIVLDFPVQDAPAEMQIWISPLAAPSASKSSEGPKASSDDPASMEGFVKLADVKEPDVVPGKPFSLEFTQAVLCRRVRLRIIMGNSKTARAAIRQLSAFGTPAVNLENIRNVDAKSIMALFQSVKSSLLYPLRPRL